MVCIAYVLKPLEWIQHSKVTVISKILSNRYRKVHEISFDFSRTGGGDSPVALHLCGDLCNCNYYLLVVM